MKNSSQTHAALDEASRNRKALKLYSILRKVADLKSAALLDIGTGSGHIANYLSQFCRSVTSVNLTDERVVKEGYRFVQIKDERLPFEDNTFDVAVSNHVIEHVPDQVLHLSEICRVLKKEGIAYLATPNKYTLIEPHYHLPFLSWCRRPLASFYLRLIKRHTWDVFPLSFGDINRMTSVKFDLDDMSVKIIKNPRAFNLDMFGPLQPVLQILPVPLLKLLHPIFPSYIVILKKK